MLDLSRSTPNLADQQLLLEQQRSELNMVQQPELANQISDKLASNPSLNAELSKYSPEQQSMLSQALSQNILNQTTSSNLPKIDGVALGQNGEIHVRFNEFCMASVDPKQIVDAPRIGASLSLNELVDTMGSSLKESEGITSTLAAPSISPIQDYMNQEMGSLTARVGGGGGFARPSLVRNEGIAAAFDVGADILGYRQMIDETKALGRTIQINHLEAIRHRMEGMGIDNLPHNAQELVSTAGGTVQIDIKASREQLIDRYFEHKYEQELVNFWGKDYTDIKIGHSGYSPEKFERAVISVMQQTVNQYEENKLNLGLAYPFSNTEQLTQNIRTDLKAFIEKEGLNDNNICTQATEVLQPFIDNLYLDNPNIPVLNPYRFGSVILPDSYSNYFMSSPTEDQFILRSTEQGGSYREEGSMNRNARESLFE